MSDPNDDVRRPPADPIDLNSEPRVTRLNRRAIGVLAAALCAALLAAVFTLSQRSQQAEQRTKESSRPSATPDRFWEDAPDGTPGLLAPPEPVPELVERETPFFEAGDSGFQNASEAMSPEEQILERARRSPIVVYEGKEAEATVAGGWAASRLAGEPGSPPRDGIAETSLGAIANLGAPEDPVVAQNLQHEKRDFLDDAGQSQEETIAHRVRTPSSPYAVLAGAVIPAVLVTEARSDLPGQVIAQVRESVFDTPTGAHLLIPQGTRAIGEYDSVVAFGQERVLVAWQRLLFPDGSSLTLGAMPGTDAAGAAGLHDRVDRHLLRTFGSAALLSAISAGAQLSQGTFGSGAGSNAPTDAREILAAALGQNLAELGTEMTRRNLSVQPALEIRAGYRFNIAVVKDLVLPGPYADDLALTAPSGGPR